MKKIWLVPVACVLGISSPALAQQDEVLTVVNRFVDGFNKSDAKAVAASCAEQTSIIDEFPPHEWHGAGACLKWMKDFEVFAKKNDITPGPVTLGKPSHVDVTDDLAYVVIPSNYTFKQKGVAKREDAAAFTFVLHKDKGEWRLIGWSWATP